MIKNRIKKEVRQKFRIKKMIKLKKKKRNNFLFKKIY
jgi:hypothetical protein